MNYSGSWAVKKKKQTPRLLRFSAVGLVVTAVSLAANMLLLKFAHTPLIPTYVVVYILTIGMSYWLNARYTFKSAHHWRRVMLYYLVYLSSMLLGTGLLVVFRAVLPLENWLLPPLVIPFTVLWNYFWSARFLKPAS